MSCVGEFHHISYSFLGFTLLPQCWSPSCLGIHTKEEKGCVQAHLYTALTMGDPWILPLREGGFAVMVQAHSWQSEKPPASRIQLLYPRISPLVRQSSSMIHKRQTSPNRDCPFSPGARGTQITGIKVILATSRVYVPVFSVRNVGLVRGLVGGGGGRGPPVTGCKEGLSGPPCSPQREGFCRHACGNLASFLQVWEVISYCKMIL